MSLPFPSKILSCAIVFALSSLSNTVLAAPAAIAPLPSAQLSHMEFGAAHAVSASPEASSVRMPGTPQNLPPSLEQIKYDLPPSSKPRLDLQLNRSNTAKLPNKHALIQSANDANANLAATPACEDMAKLATYQGAALADYLVSLPNYECHYGLFSLTSAQANVVYSAANLDAVARRFVSEAAAYNASNIKLVNLLIYLRAGYFLASGKVINQPASGVATTLRPAINKLVNGNALFQENATGSSTASETMKLITNMNDEAYYLPAMKTIVQRYTNSNNNPKAVDGLKGYSASSGFTGVLTVFFYAHYRPEGKTLLQADASYPQALYDFFSANKAALLGGANQYQLTDTEREAFRFLQYSAQKPLVKTMLKNVLASSTMTGSDSALWLEAASSVSSYDKANCAEYGTCNFETKLADAVLKNSYTCSPSLKIRAQEMTQAQLQDSCKSLAAQETYFHKMLQTNNKPVANDLNTSLELVVFDDYTNYAKYAGMIYGIDTNNGGMYLEGNPSKAGNQARFIAHEASWLRPSFKVWNLEHEYVHYLDGRFNMAGDFGAGTAKPTVWWIEGVAEYLTLRNDNKASIDAAKKGTYKLSTIFGNTYSMNDYTTRAYRWGYMATRFMNERHRSDVDAVVAKFRAGDYNSYQNYIDVIGNRYDAEFASWVQSATTAGEPPLPVTNTPTLPACPRTDKTLRKNCSISGFASDYRAYSYIMLPAGAKNLRIFTSGGTGDVNLYLAADRYPSPTSGDLSSATKGNNESISIAKPVSGHWYYVTLDAKKPFANVILSATYD